MEKNSDKVLGFEEELKLEGFKKFGKFYEKDGETVAIYANVKSICYFLKVEHEDFGLINCDLEIHYRNLEKIDIPLLEFLRNQSDRKIKAYIKDKTQ